VNVATAAGEEPFVPDDFMVPLELRTDDFTLAPLGPEHNERDYAAWTSSMEHIKATPGLVDWSWPYEMPLASNLEDLTRHAQDFGDRRGFTYTVLDHDQDVVGCVYIYPVKPSEDGAPVPDARVRSWVRASRAELDVVLWQTVSAWLAASWPFESVEYATR
jgi:hypothetical protein